MTPPFPSHALELSAGQNTPDQESNRQGPVLSDCFHGRGNTNV